MEKEWSWLLELLLVRTLTTPTSPVALARCQVANPRCCRILPACNRFVVTWKALSRALVDQRERAPWNLEGTEAVWKLRVFQMGYSTECS